MQIQLDVLSRMVAYPVVPSPVATQSSTARHNRPLPGTPCQVRMAKTSTGKIQKFELRKMIAETE